mmetsp:Transcript_40485/g.100108  ORF Transcript_40485/g.100108 Transcript_40485/m.100108 type:complete len:284 (-) Transcript_40485:424-1275(-)
MLCEKSQWMRRSSMSTLSILKYAASASSLVSKLMNAKLRESPVLKSRTMSHDSTVPKRLKMISRSSSVVTGLRRHTNSDSSGGLASTSGKSPIISSTTARLCASFSRIAFSCSSASRPLSAGTQSSSSRVSLGSLTSSGDASGMNFSSPGGSSNGSSNTIACLMRMFCHGRPAASQYASLMASSTSRPSLTCPNTVCFSSSASQSSLVVIRNWLAFMSAPPEFAIDTVPFFLCFSVGRISSSKNRAWSPYRNLYTLSPPWPVPVGSPLCTQKSLVTAWNRQLL